MENLSKKIGYIIVITFWLVTLTMLTVMTGCYVTSYTPNPVYEDHPHTTEIYWATDYEIGGSPYFGYWDDFWYYYGVPHFYPWWYYYQYIPPHYYYAQWHVHIQCNQGNYVYGHRGPLFHNIGPECPTNQGRYVPTIKPKNNKDKSFVFPRDWKSNNSNINNINKIDYDRIFNNNPQTNIKPINNKNNTINKGNNGSKRSNKTNTTRKSRK